MSASIGEVKTGFPRIRPGLTGKTVRLEKDGFPCDPGETFARQKPASPAECSLKPSPSVKPRSEPESKPWELQKVDPRAWLGVDKVWEAYGLTGKGVMVAVIDSGFNRPGTEPAVWKDFGAGAPEPIDDFGHGTHSAGDVAQIAPGAQIAALKVGGPDGKIRDSSVVEALQWAIEHKDQYNLKVINISLQLEQRQGPGANPVDLAVEKAVEAGITVVAAAGNLGRSSGEVTVPGENPNAITVGALSPQNRISRISSRGPAVIGFAPPDADHPYPRPLVSPSPKPELYAPGEFIASWMAPGSQMAEDALRAEKVRQMNGAQLKEFFTKNPQELGKYKVSRLILDFDDQKREERVKSKLLPLFVTPDGLLATEGTSFAAPLVAGIAALLLEARSDLTPQQIKTLLIETAKKAPQYGDTPGGLADAKAALDRLLSPPKKEAAND